MRTRTICAAVALTGMSTAALTGCAVGRADTPAPGSTVQLMGDYPVYDTTTLPEGAAIVVEGTAVGAESTVLTPRFEGDTPEENPLLGLSEEEKRKAMAEDEGVPATATTFRVDVVHKGDVAVGDTITIIQTGGVVDNVTYEVEGEETLDQQDSYLLFAVDSFDGTYAVVGGSAGIYQEVEMGEFEAADPVMAPFDDLTSDEAAELTD